MLLSSPAIDLAWSVLSCLLGIFFLYHLWSFDRFRCMRWDNESNAGFKRFMTYTYFTGVPLIITYSVGFCVIKYSEGYIFLPEFGTIVKPPQLWTESHQRTILPLQLCAAFAWGLELVTHLETLCFSIFLINSASSKDWFQSWYFRSWALGSFISVLYIPMVTLLTGSDPIKCEIFTALAGSSGSLLLTIFSMITMRNFVPFVERLRREGVCMSVIVRLTKFRELITIYIFSRTLFAVPLFILSADGVGDRHFLSGSCLARDLLLIVAGFGFAITFAILLPIFFPRSIETEISRVDSLKNTHRDIAQGRHHTIITFTSRERELEAHEPDRRLSYVNQYPPSLNMSGKISATNMPMLDDDSQGGPSSRLSLYVDKFTSPIDISRQTSESTQQRL